MTIQTRPDGGTFRAIITQLCQIRHLRPLGMEMPFEDIRWSIILAVYGAEIDGRMLTRSDISIVTNIPGSSARRSVKSLVQDEILELLPDKTDRRRAFVVLHVKHCSAILEYLAAAASTPLCALPPDQTGTPNQVGIKAHPPFRKSGSFQPARIADTDQASRHFGAPQ